MLVRFSLSFAMVVLFVAGCSRQSPTVTVSGTVTYQDQPLAEASVSFIPIDGGRPATGETDGSGRFTLTTFKSGDGALPGEHVVIVEKLQQRKGDDVYAEYESVIPKRYGHVKHSDLKADVVLRGSNEFVFALQD